MERERERERERNKFKDDYQIKNPEDKQETYNFAQSDLGSVAEISASDTQYSIIVLHLSACH